MSSIVNFQNIKVCTIQSLNNEDLEEIVWKNNLQIKRNSLIPYIHSEKITNFLF